MKDQCISEIKELHQFFEDWFAGKLEQTEDVFSRFSQVLNDEFTIISPDGSQTGKKRLVQEFKNGYGKYQGSEMEIWVESPNVRHQSDDFCLMNYEEWQKLGGEMNTRLSTALFKKNDDLPNGVEWIHVHETGIRSSTHSRLSQD